jgi:hypothetical protein
MRDPVAPTLFLSMGQIGRNNAFAIDCVFLTACVDRKDISIEVLETISPQTTHRAFKVLDQYTLITGRPAESALDIHQLVHQALRKQLKAQGRIQYWTRHTSHNYTGYFQMTTTVTEATGDDCCRMYNTFFLIVRSVRVVEERD